MDRLKILLPKGRIYDSVVELLSDIGVSIYLPERTYFPITNREDLAFQVVKPQIASLLLKEGRADVCFSGADWAVENGVINEIDEVMDLGFDPVKIVAAIPESEDFDALKKEPLTVATEYEKISRTWLEKNNLKGEVFRTWGTSEGFVQARADSIAKLLIDNTSTGSSLKANKLKVVDTLMESSTRFYANKAALSDEKKRALIEQLKMLFGTVLAARERVMLEMNVAERDFEPLVEALPAMKSPTVSPLFNSNAYAIKTVVKKSEVPDLLVKLRELGATDIVEYSLRKVLL